MFTLNTQTPEGPAAGTGESLDVVAVWGTLQGEGPFAGVPAAFVRLAGCNLRCPACDTGYTAGRTTRRTEDIAAECFALRVAARPGVRPLAVLTGGEPLRQPVGPLARLLLALGFRVQVETNGVLFPADFPYADVTVVCSPKTPRVHPRLMPHVAALKYVLAAGDADPLDGLPATALGSPGRPCRPWPGFMGDVSVQPLDSQDAGANAANLAAAAAACLAHGYRLGVQLHKLAGVA